MMNFDELLDNLRHEYHGHLAAEYQDENAPRILHTEDAPSFYDYLLMRGLSRQKLAAHGIGRDVEA